MFRWCRRCDGSLVQQSRTLCFCTFFLSFPRLFVRFTCNSCRLAVKQFSLKLLLCLCRDKFSFIIKFSSDTQRVLQYQPNLSVRTEQHVARMHAVKPRERVVFCCLLHAPRAMVRVIYFVLPPGHFITICGFRVGSSVRFILWCFNVPKL